MFSINIFFYNFRHILSVCPYKDRAMTAIWIGLHCSRIWDNLLGLHKQAEFEMGFCLTKDRADNRFGTKGRR